MQKINRSKINQQKIQPQSKVKLEEAELNSVSAATDRYLAIAVIF